MAWKVFDLIANGIITIKNKVLDIDSDGFLLFDGNRVGLDMPPVIEASLPEYTPDFSKSKYFEYTLNQDSIILSPIEQEKGRSGTIVIKQDSSGSHLITQWHSDFVFPEGEPDINIEENAYNVFRYTVVENNKILIEFISDFV